MNETPPRGALDGLKVVDLSRVLAGPFCAQMLADHGAEVIKVEPPAGDETRQWGPPFNESGSAAFLSVNRNKRTLAMDLSQPSAREVLFRLLADADVLVENFKAGTLERWGLGFADVLQARFPRLVHCTITGFGVDGPWGGMPGYDLFVQAWSGMISMNGSIESGPFRISVPLVDLATGTNAALGVMMALRRREATGRGQHVEVALFDVALSLLVPAAQLHFIAGAAPGLAGNRHGSIAPFSLHKTRGRSIFLSAGSDRAFRNLCSILGKPQLGADPRFLTNRDRLDNVEALTAELDDGMAERDGEELALELMAKGVGAGALFTVADALDHPHTEHREMVVDVDGQKTLGVPIRLSESPGSARARPPAFNEHVDDILQELGFSADEAADLQRSNAVSGSTAHAPD